MAFFFFDQSVLLPAYSDILLYYFFFVVVARSFLANHYLSVFYVYLINTIYTHCIRSYVGSRIVLLIVLISTIEYYSVLLSTIQYYSVLFSTTRSIRSK